MTITLVWQQKDTALAYLSSLVYGGNKCGQYLNSLLTSKVATRLRAGVFDAIPVKMKSFRVLTNSRFNSDWVAKYWRVDSQVFYPPVDLLFDKYDLSKHKKKNYICSVGRFFTLGHGKKQEVLIEAFKQMCDDGLQGWQLHLAGGLGDESSSQEFAAYLQQLAHGYPIFFHFNASKKVIDDLYLHSKIYWHATGFGENENQNPIKMEHFGFAPIEAISAGCWPLLYRGGGLPETIENLGGSSENLFATQQELIDKTQAVIKQKPKTFLTPARKKQLQELYGRESFRKKIVELI